MPRLLSNLLRLVPPIASHHAKAALKQLFVVVLQDQLQLAQRPDLPIKVELVRANHNGPNSPYEWSTELPPLFQGHLDPSAFAASMAYFNETYRVRYAFLVGLPAIIFAIIAAILVANHIINVATWIVIILFVATLTSAMIWRYFLPRILHDRMTIAIQGENVYYRDWCRQNGSPVNVVWSLSSRQVEVHRGRFSSNREIEAESVILCEVSRASQIFTPTIEIQVVEGQNPFEVSQGVSAPVAIPITESLPPPTSSPHDQYVTQP